MAEAFVQTDKNCMRSIKHSGSTATVVALTKDRLIVANAGDCRCVLFKMNELGQGQCIALSTDHKPDREDEKQRIITAGGYVMRLPNDVWRVDGVLAVSRAFGDFALKRENSSKVEVNRGHVIVDPEITTYVRTSEDRFIILARLVFSPVARR